jgi:GTP-binding protein
MKLAIVGKRNAGKSSFINALAGEERVIVSEIPGTTRDSVDVNIELDGRTFTVIDTAGFRKRKSLSGDIEFYSLHRAMRSIRRADVVAMLIDASVKVSQVDKDLAGQIAAEFKPVVLVVNKWDLAKGRASSDDYGAYLLKTLPGLDYAPVAFTTAKTARNVQSVLHLAGALFKQARTRVSTGELNQLLKAATEQNAPRPKHGAGQVKLLYATQVAVCPPTVVMFVNDPARITPPYERFLMNRMREALPFAEVPIRLIYRGRRGLKATREVAEPRSGG